jgi:AcrR family transcriptional regulator
MKQRARKAEDKQERRSAILKAALELWSQETSFASFNIADVAERAELAKGTVYHHFATKESLLLALLEEQLWAWFDLIDVQLRSSPGGWTCSRMAYLFSSTIAERRALLRLLSLLETILAHNITFEEALAFRTKLKERMITTGEWLERRLSFLRTGTGAGAVVIVQIRALMVGFQQMSSPSPTMVKVLEQPGMSFFRVDFASDFNAAVRTLLEGAERAAREALQGLRGRELSR